MFFLRFCRTRWGSARPVLSSRGTSDQRIPHAGASRALLQLAAGIAVAGSGYAVSAGPSLAESAVPASDPSAGARTTGEHGKKFDWQRAVLLAACAFEAYFDLEEPRELREVGPNGCQTTYIDKCGRGRAHGSVVSRVVGLAGGREDGKKREEMRDMVSAMHITREGWGIGRPHECVDGAAHAAAQDGECVLNGAGISCSRTARACSSWNSRRQTDSRNQTW